MIELDDSTSLPDGWITTSLDKVAEIIMGQSPPGDSYNQEGEGIPLINGPVEFGSEPFSKTIKSKFTTLPTKMCEENDLILCVRGSTTGRMNIAGFDACIGRGVAAIRYKPYQQYVNLFVHSNRDRVYRLGTGSTFPNVSSNNLAELQIPLPPLNEQRRIVSSIEQLTDRSHKARAALEDVPKLIAQFRQSVLAAAFRGDLTADWREKNLGKQKLEQSVEIKEYYYHKVTGAGAWEKCLFQDICTVIGGSQPSKNNFIYEPKEGYIRLIQIRDYKSDKFITFIPKELARRFCNESDIMIGRYGPPIFQILRGLEGAYNVALMKAEPNLEKVDKEFLFYYLQTPHLFNYVEAASQRTAGQDGVKKELLNTYTVFVPSLDEQLLIVKKVKEAFKAIDIIENQHLQLFQEIPGLDRSILAKAFRGELVSQDPNDEPAAVLLERIRAEREQTSTPKQRGKTTRKNSSKQRD